MIKMIVLDVDGVIVGSKHGVNFPYPHVEVISALKKIRESGIPIVLCSGKYFPVVKPIIERAALENPHITDAGGFIYNLSEAKISSFAYNPRGNNISFEINKNVLASIIDSLLSEAIYTEAYTETNYYTQKDKIPYEDFLKSKSRKAILQRGPKLVKSVTISIKDKKIFKVIAFAMNEAEKRKVEKIIKPYLDKISFVWSGHPATGKIAYGLITSKTASKPLAVLKVADSLGIPVSNTLGVGDTMGDWEFMKTCGYTATMAEAPEELKKLVQFVAPSVNDNGILQILDYFLK